MHRQGVAVYAAWMSGGVAVRANLLCVTWSSAQGHVFLFDLEAGVRLSQWTMPAAPGGWSDAAGVVIDEHFSVYVADPHQDRVRCFSAFGRHLADFGRSAVGDGDAARDRLGVLHQPRAVALVGDDLLVVHGELPRRLAVQRFARDGRPGKALACLGDPDAKFAGPQGVATDAGGIYVADTGAGRIQRFRPDGRFVAAVRCGEVGEAARPVAVWPRQGGKELVAIDRGDRPGVFVVDLSGRRRGVPEMAERLQQPVALAGDAAGRIYVLDRGGERVVRFAPDLRFDAELVDLVEFLDDYQPPGHPPPGGTGQP